MRLSFAIGQPTGFIFGHKAVLPAGRKKKTPLQIRYPTKCIWYDFNDYIMDGDLIVQRNWENQMQKVAANKSKVFIIGK